MEEFITFLSRFITLEDSEIDFVKNNMPIKSYKKREIIQQEGEVVKKFYFNAEGFVRMYYLADGKEKTAFFYPKNTFVSDYESYVHETPTKINFQAMEQTRLVEISKDTADHWLAASPKFAQLAVKLMEDDLILHQNIIREVVTQSPEERYYQMMENSPEIFQKVPQQHIAAFLGLVPESLSRIKKRHFAKT